MFVNGVWVYKPCLSIIEVSFYFIFLTKRFVDETDIDTQYNQQVTNYSIWKKCVTWTQS